MIKSSKSLLDSRRLPKAHCNRKTQRWDVIKWAVAINVGLGAAAICPVNALLTVNTQVNHAEITRHASAVNRAFEAPNVAQFLNPVTEAGRAALAAMITHQA